jgi:hypothetical protein
MIQIVPFEVGIAIEKCIEALNINIPEALKTSAITNPLSQLKIISVLLQEAED